MISRAQSPPMTYEDLLRLPEDLLRHELISGEHYVSPAPALKHQDIVVSLTRILSTFVRSHRLGKVLVGPVDVLFTQRDVVEPDVVYVSGAKADRLRERYVAGAPDLVIEVLSPSNRMIDRTKKYRLYEAHGVPEYWIVDPAAETLEVYRATNLGGPLALSGELSLAAGDVLETPLLPGLRIPLSEVFE
ncbi:MAG TPA: Uma2 family endonuclease [Thermoanaerobaculia bacterium]|nr:Uma2 family endonuclease [Thermoanaerobaculia bacterium]